MNERHLADKTKMVFPAQTCRGSAIAKVSAAPSWAQNPGLEPDSRERIKVNGLTFIDPPKHQHGHRCCLFTGLETFATIAGWLWGIHFRVREELHPFLICWHYWSVSSLFSDKWFDPAYTGWWWFQVISISDFIFRCFEVSSQQVSTASTVRVDEDRAASANHQNWFPLCFFVSTKASGSLGFPLGGPGPPLQHASLAPVSSPLSHSCFLFFPIKRSPLLSSVLLLKCCKSTVKVQLLQLKPFLASL